MYAHSKKKMSKINTWRNPRDLELYAQNLWCAILSTTWTYTGRKPAILTVDQFLERIDQWNEYAWMYRILNFMCLFDIYTRSPAIYPSDM